MLMKSRRWKAVKSKPEEVLINEEDKKQTTDLSLWRNAVRLYQGEMRSNKREVISEITPHCADPIGSPKLCFHLMKKK